MKKVDIVKLQREDIKGVRYYNILEVMKSASERYLKIRPELELLDRETSIIVKHIKSFEDWEYFLEYALEQYIKINMAKGNEAREMYSKFNAVRVVGGIIELKYEPIHARFDGNNYTYGFCSFDDILHIDEIIKTQKEK